MILKTDTDICKLKSLFFNPFKSIVQSAQTHFAFPNSRHASTHTTCQDLMGDVKVMDTNNTARTWSFNVFLFFFFFCTYWLLNHKDASLTTVREASEMCLHDM